MLISYLRCAYFNEWFTHDVIQLFHKSEIENNVLESLQNTAMSMKFDIVFDKAQYWYNTCSLSCIMRLDMHKKECLASAVVN